MSEAFALFRDSFFLEGARLVLFVKSMVSTAKLLKFFFALRNLISEVSEITKEIGVIRGNSVCAAVLPCCATLADPAMDGYLSNTEILGSVGHSSAAVLDVVFVRPIKSFSFFSSGVSSSFLASHGLS